MKIISKVEAKEQGLDLFFTGKPCKYGHIAERRTRNSDCLQCARERAAKYALDNKEQLLEKAAKYRAEHREELKVKAKDYYHSNKEARSVAAKAYREKTKDAIKAYQAVYREKNRGKAKEYKARYYLDNREDILAKTAANIRKKPEIARESSRRYRRNNKEKIYALTRLKQAEKMQRTPLWLTEDDLWMMREIYALATLRTKLTKVRHEVDHIVPLKGKTVSGFHVPTNLQVLTKAENRLKHNQWDPDNGQ